MTNLIGREAEEWAKLAAEPDARLHLYGKREARPGRKMGHVNRMAGRPAESSVPLGARAAALEHVQLAMPEGQEAKARAFYAGLLGIPEVDKPANLKARGGCWFQSGELRIHLGVEKDFRPARKAHPALLVGDLAALSARAQCGRPSGEERGAARRLHARLRGRSLREPHRAHAAGRRAKVAPGALASPVEVWWMARRLRPALSGTFHEDQRQRNPAGRRDRARRVALGRGEDADGEARQGAGLQSGRAEEPHRRPQAQQSLRHRRAGRGGRDPSPRLPVPLQGRRHAGLHEQRDV